MFRPVRRSLRQTLTRAVIKACAFTFALMVSYVSTAVVSDMSNLADGHQDDELIMGPILGPDVSHGSAPQPVLRQHLRAK